MRHLFLALALCAAFAFEGSAQIYAQYPIPEALQQNDCDLVDDPASPRNTGGEPLGEFIERFCADTAFCESRLYDPDFENIKEEDNEESWLVTLVRELREYGLLDFTPGTYEGRCMETLNTWYGVTADHALFLSNTSFNCDPADPESGVYDGGGMNIWTFERKDGKWFVTDILVIG